jgi:hypothetical protein
MDRNATERLFDELKAKRDKRVHNVDESRPVVDESYCVACGVTIDYCQGHGEIGDPEGYHILRMHDLDIHDQCDPHGCDEGPMCPEGPCAHPSHDDWFVL